MAINVLENGQLAVLVDRNNQVYYIGKIKNYDRLKDTDADYTVVVFDENARFGVKDQQVYPLDTDPEIDMVVDKWEYTPETGFQIRDEWKKPSIYNIIPKQNLVKYTDELTELVVEQMSSALGDDDDADNSTTD